MFSHDFYKKCFFSSCISTTVFRCMFFRNSKNSFPFERGWRDLRRSCHGTMTFVRGRVRGSLQVECILFLWIFATVRTNHQMPSTCNKCTPRTSYVQVLSPPPSSSLYLLFMGFLLIMMVSVPAACRNTVNIIPENNIWREAISFNTAGFDNRCQNVMLKWRHRLLLSSYNTVS